MRNVLLAVVGVALGALGCAPLEYPGDGGQDAGDTVAPVSDCGADGLDGTVEPKPPVAVPAVTVPRLVDPGSSVTIFFDLTGPAGDAFSYQVIAASGGGSFAPYEGMMSFGPDGKANLGVSYSAPATEGKYTHTLIVNGALEKTFDVEVKPLQLRIGYSGPQSDQVQMSANFLFAYGIEVPGPMKLRGFGLYSKSAVGAPTCLCRMGLYENTAANEPYQLLVPSPLIVITPGQNEVEVPQGAMNTDLAAGPYWLALKCDCDLLVAAGASDFDMFFMGVDDVQSTNATFDTGAGTFQSQTLSMYIIADN